MTFMFSLFTEVICKNSCYDFNRAYHPHMAKVKICRWLYPWMKRPYIYISFVLDLTKF